MTLPRFLHNFWRKLFVLLCFIDWPNFLSGCLYFVRYWAICVLELIVNQVVTSWILMLISLIKLLFLHDQNVVTKSEIFWEQKKLLRQNKKHFSSFLKRFSVGYAQIYLKQILRFQEFWLFQYTNSSMIPVKTSLDYKIFSNWALTKI